ncbi:hypothetical protein MGG_17536 [Pyricularia oryzae 70-15]|uniref:Uncharacterized protein n=1 Tax=Pyricularia oryzae (strain 70-15 / ATCC MYA-4617 / FGSC 8958) TaxID=242507 RepID=G4NEH1_PYRO7|nr:uncharacterized protein MGG_17536 [Pyricularia oryzae 70-15]EHA49448.1 hypothetical protein MGG_17536 [Pyricularia oryzae 70-15]
MFRSSFISGSLLLLSLLGNVQAGVVQPPAVKSAIIPIELDLDPQLIIKAGGLTPKLAKTVTNQQIVTAALDTDIIQEIKKKHPRKPTYVRILLPPPPPRLPVARITRLAIDNNHPPVPSSPHLLGTSSPWLQTTDSSAVWTQAPLDEEPSTAVRRILPQANAIWSLACSATCQGRRTRLVMLIPPQMGVVDVACRGRGIREGAGQAKEGFWS